ncbi:MAG: FtsX-like permease family protein [Hamadaea sp.]|uniref:FtsX-like permease family protein n=1 Tax=Hamadaea sp. TaxID=2024425 RepID=UPI0017EBE262|nr:FtsX-like permease family protein [Hamadaea sp.]NUR70863.1 FtsX-like permease family protein [Hamadaea sp.]NUT20882.1 FtsX-like permease family protein [Hamadaea sp.]
MIARFRLRVWPWIWLGLRMCAGSGKAMLLRTILLGAACAAGVFLVLAAMAVPVVADAQHERSYARTPVVAEDGTDGLKMVMIYDAVDSRPLLRVAVANAGPGNPLPPGIDAFPAPGQIVVSPALRELIISDESVHYRFPQPIAGVIGASGLVAPDELYAYVGVDSDELSEPTGVVTGYMDSSNEQWKASLGSTELERMLTPPRVVSASFALFLVVPLSVLLGICVRFDASRRDRRLAALRLVGASRRQAYLSAATEMAIIAGTGVAAGVAVFMAVAGLSEGWRVGRFHWYASDIQVPASRIAVLAVLTVGLAIAVSALGSRPAITSPIRIRRSGKASGASRWRLLPLLVGPVALLIAPSTLLTPLQRLIVLAVGILSAVVALATVTPIILNAAGAATTRFSRLPLWAQLAARRATHSPAITPKLVTGVLVAVFVAGFGMMIATTVRAGKPVPTAVEAAADESPVVEAFGVPRQVAERLRGSPAIAGMSTLQRDVATGSAAGQHAVVVHASCRDAAALFERIGECVDGTAYRIRHADGAQLTSSEVKPGDLLVVAYGDRKGQSVAVPATSLEVSGMDFGCQCDILIAQAVDTGDLVIRLAGPNTGFWPDVARKAPATWFQGNQDRRRGFDADAVLTLIFVGLTLSVSLGMVAFVIASIDRSIESRHRDAPLLAIGVPVRFLRAAEAAQLLLVIVSGLVLGLGLLALTTHAWAGVFTISFSTVLGALLPLFGSVIAGMIILIMTVMALTTRDRALAPEELRRE